MIDNINKVVDNMEKAEQLEEKSGRLISLIRKRRQLRWQTTSTKQRRKLSDRCGGEI